MSRHISDAERERFLDRVSRERAAQGLPDKVTDPDALRLIAALVTTEPGVGVEP